MTLRRRNMKHRRTTDADARSRDPASVNSAIAAMKAAFSDHERGDLTHAEQGYREALGYNPRFAEAHHALGVLLQQRGQMSDALASFQQALALRPNAANSYYQCGEVLMALRRHADAAHMFRQAIDLAPDHVDAHDKLGQTLFQLYENEQAVEVYRAGLELDPENASLNHNLALSLIVLGERVKAAQSLEKAVANAPENSLSLCYLISNKMYLCDWERLEELAKKLVRRIVENGDAVDPFTFQGLACAPTNAEQLACAEANGVVVGASLKAMGGEAARFADYPRESCQSAAERIRIGYVSMDFRIHPMAYLMTEILANHDRDRFEVFAYSYGPAENSEERKRFEAAVDHFIDNHHMSDDEAARRIHSDRIDILIDRKGYTFGHRLGIFARKPAPVQVNYLAFGGTMGVDFIDYAVVDDYVVPPDQQQFYSERLVYLPDCYQPNSFRPISDQTPSRAECGLPEEGFIFCCFNQTYKLTPRVFDVWMRILNRVPGSALWLLKPDEATAENLRREASTRGIAPDRLVFAPKVGQAQHLARHRHAGLFLDTEIVNALTTASDALRMDCPVITCPGHSFVSRGAGSILHALEMPELIAADLGAYEEMAVRLAQSPDDLRAMREKIARKRETAPLFDSIRYTRHLDAAFTEMARIRSAGGRPRQFAVAPTENPFRR